MEELLRGIYDIVYSRKITLPEGSYTAELFREGKKEILRKVLEEAAEVAIASGFEGRGALISELADLWFHTIVLMVEEGITIEDVLEELRSRRR